MRWTHERLKKVTLKGKTGIIRQLRGGTGHASRGLAGEAQPVTARHPLHRTGEELHRGVVQKASEREVSEGPTKETRPQHREHQHEGLSRGRGRLEWAKG